VIRNKSVKVDRRNIATMVIPGIFTMETLFAPAGQGAQAGKRRWGQGSTGNCQFMTPETEADHHTFSGPTSTIFEGEDSTISLSLLDSLIEGFMEDKEIIERPAEVRSRRIRNSKCSPFWAGRASRAFSGAFLEQARERGEGWPRPVRSIDPRQTTTAVGQTGR